MSSLTQADQLALQALHRVGEQLNSILASPDNIPPHDGGHLGSFLQTSSAIKQDDRVREKLSTAYEKIPACLQLRHTWFRVAPELLPDPEAARSAGSGKPLEDAAISIERVERSDSLGGLAAKLSFSQISAQSSAISKAKLLPFEAAMTIVKRRPLRPARSGIARSCGDNDEHLVGDAAVTLAVHELPDQATYKPDGVGEVGTRSCSGIDMAADLELLANGGGLRIHPENRFEPVPGTTTGVAEVQSKTERSNQTEICGSEVGIDLRREESIDIRAWRIDDFVYGIVTG